MNQTQPKKPKVRMPKEALEYFREMGRIGGRIGGRISGPRMTSEQARALVMKRWGKRKPKTTVDTKPPPEP